jgi:hypothetical protein
MLDATDRETEGAIVAVRRVHDSRVEDQKVAIDTITGGTPRIADRPRDIERTGSTLTQARSRIKSNRSILYKTDRITQKSMNSLTGIYHIANRYVIPG